MPVLMEVLRDGYFDGTYPRAGDLIEVADPFVARQLEMAGFAIRPLEPDPPPPPTTTPEKGSKHGRRLA